MIDELKTRISSLEHMSPDDWRQVLNELTDKARETKETQPSLLSPRGKLPRVHSSRPSAVSTSRRGAGSLSSAPILPSA